MYGVRQRYTLSHVSGSQGSAPGLGKRLPGPYGTVGDSSTKGSEGNPDTVVRSQVCRAFPPWRSETPERTQSQTRLGPLSPWVWGRQEGSLNPKQSRTGPGGVPCGYPDVQGSLIKGPGFRTPFDTESSTWSFGPGLPSRPPVRRPSGDAPSVGRTGHPYDGCGCPGGTVDGGRTVPGRDTVLETLRSQG